MINNSIQVFDYEDFTVRTYTDENGEVWLVAKDVCDFLGIVNSRDAVSELDDDEKADVAISDGSQRRHYNIINEAGLYKLTFRSKKPNAKEFTRKVTHEILPSIRKTGSYTIPEKRKPAVVSQDKKPLPQTSAPVKAAERITKKLFKCKKTEDFEAVLALDKVYSKTFGQSAIVIAGYRIIKDITHVLLHIGTGVITGGDDEISYSLRKADTVDFSLLSDEPCIEVIHDEEKYIDSDTVKVLWH